MTASLVPSLPADAVLTADGEGRFAIQARGERIAFPQLSEAMQHVLQTLANGGGTEEQLAEHVEQADGDAGLRRLYHVLHQLTRRGWLAWSADEFGKRLATLVPWSRHFVYAARVLEPDRPYVLSRFAYMRAEAGQVLLESPLAHAQIVLHDPRAAALVHALARPTTDLSRHPYGLAGDAALRVVELLLNADLIGEADDAGTAVCDRAAALQSWEFHDLLFHARSRLGRHSNPSGATYRFVGGVPAPAALKATQAAESLALDRPDLDRLQCCDPPFARIQESRKSIREYAERPITAQQLGEFLYRVARVKECAEFDVPTPRETVRMAFATRPYPGGGGLHELELYVAVNACEGIAPGLYRYDPMCHRLEHLSERTPEVDRLFRDAEQSTVIAEDKLQLLLIVAAQFTRVAWKYASMAYALILKDVGVLYQTMYLAATAMNLAPCAIGSGDADLFARAAGTDYYAETSVGEFLLGSKPRLLE
jgi:SagB-type dehydrogenase family enzyme